MLEKFSGAERKTTEQPKAASAHPGGAGGAVTSEHDDGTRDLCDQECSSSLTSQPATVRSHHRVLNFKKYFNAETYKK